MSNINSDGELGVDIGFDYWTPLYFETEWSARDSVELIKAGDTLDLYEQDGHCIYHEASENRFVIFVKKSEN